VVDHAYLIVTAWLGSEPIGSVTVLSDGMNYATFDDVVVHPDYRLRGIGSELMRRALARLTHIADIKLDARPDAEPFYERLGFHPSGEVAMYLKGPRGRQLSHE
jgi:GNAT superfamily N-acetyltransferase